LNDFTKRLKQTGSITSTARTTANIDAVDELMLSHEY